MTTLGITVIHGNILCHQGVFLIFGSLPAIAPSLLCSFPYNQTAHCYPRAIHSQHPPQNACWTVSRQLRPSTPHSLFIFCSLDTRPGVEAIQSPVAITLSCPLHKKLSTTNTSITNSTLQYCPIYYNDHYDHLGSRHRKLRHTGAGRLGDREGAKLQLCGGCGANETSIKVNRSGKNSL